MYGPLSAKLYTHLRLKFTHLNEHKFNYGFSNTINPIRVFRTEVETTEHFLLRCHFYSTQRSELFDKFVESCPKFLISKGRGSSSCFVK